jgi:hypothetical protein
MNFGIDRSMQQFPSRATLPSPMTLTNRELIEEADQLARRISHNDVTLRDVRIVQELAVRLGNKS